MFDGSDLPAWVSLILLESPWWAFGLFFAMALTEMVFPPFPGDTVFFLGLVAVQAGGQSVIGPMVATLFGGLAGFAGLYWLGKTRGRKLFSKQKTGLFSLDSLTRVETWFSRWGGFAIVVGRFLSGVRSVVPLSAGVSAYPPVQTLVLGAISIALWNGLLAAAALLLHQNWERVARLWNTYSLILWILVGITLIAMAGRSFIRRRRAG